MFPFFISTRYLRTRLIAGISAIAIACAVVIAYVPNPVMEGFLTELKAKVRGTSADVLVQTRDPFDPDALSRKLLKLDSRIKAISPRLEGNLIFSTGDEVDNFDYGQVIGVDAVKESAVSHFAAYLDNGGTPRDRPFEMKPETLREILKRRAVEEDLGRIAVEAQEKDARDAALRTIARDRGERYYTPEQIAEKVDAMVKRYSIDREEAEAIIQERFGETRAKTEKILVAREGRKAFNRLDAEEAKRRCRAATLPEGVEKTSAFRAELERIRRRPAVIVGRSLLETWKSLRLGGEIELISGRFSGPLEGMEPPKGRNFLAVIVGVYDSGFYDFDVRTLYMSLPHIEAFLGDITPVRSLGLKLQDWREAEAVRDGLKEVLGPSGFNVTTWKEQKDVILQAVKRQKDVLFVILFFADIVAGIGILITLRILVAEKIRDIGIFSAIGSSPFKVMTTFVLTGLSIALMGAAVGIGAGMTIVSLSNEIVSALSWLGLTEFHTYVHEIQHLKRIPVEYRVGTLLKVVASTVISAFLFSLYPAFLAARLKPIDAIRREFL
ncbi:MAG: ABC transporter permease [Planctomycetota bacterium]|jgi:lipoprotein-releasing system permease protein